LLILVYGSRSTDNSIVVDQAITSVSGKSNYIRLNHLQVISLKMTKNKQTGLTMMKKDQIEEEQEDEKETGEVVLTTNTVF
jgi:hypothetical protein